MSNASTLPLYQSHLTLTAYLLNKEACLMILALISHYVNSCCIICSRSSQTILQKATKLPYRTVHNITCKEFLAYDICTHLDDGQQGIKSKKNCQIFLLVLEIPLVLFERIPLTNHIFVAVYNVLHLRNSFIQPVSHARCHTLMKDNESVSIPPRKAPIESHA